MPQEKSAGAIIYILKNGVPHYLLLHYLSGYWEFAKGHIEEGETPEVAAKREIQEETGIKNIMLIPGFKEYSKYTFRKSYDLVGEAKKKAPWVFKLVVFYLAQTFSEEVRVSYEHKGFLWLPYDEAVKKLKFKNAKTLIERANDFLVSKKEGAI